MKGVKGSTLPLSEEEAVKRVEEIIRRKNERPEISLSFLGFAEKWHGNMTKLIVHCNIHNLTWNTTSYNNFMKLRTIGCMKCKGETTTRTHLLTPEQAYDRLVKRYEKAGITNFDFTPVLTTYTGFQGDVNVWCTKHNKMITYPYVVFYSYVHQNHCIDCYNEFRKEIRYPEESELISRINDKIAKLKERDYDVEFLGFKLRDDEPHPTTNSKIILKCNIHNLTWDTSSVSNFVDSNGVCCPECSRHSKRSNGERTCYAAVSKIVPIECIKSDKVFSFSDYRFYNITNTILPDIFITGFGKEDIVIEFDGEQHYRYVDFVHGSWERYIKQVRRDQFLEEYCKEHNIRLLRVPWLDEKRISEIIQAFLLHGKDITTKVYPKIPPVVII